MSIERKIQLLSNHPLLNSVKSETLYQLAKEATFQEFSSGETAIKKNEIITGIYFVAHGHFEALQSQDKGSQSVIDQYHRKGHFGDNCLFAETPSDVEIRSSMNSLILKLDRKTLINEITNNPSFRQRVHSRFSDLMKQGQKNIKTQSGTVISIGSAESQVGKSIFGINLAAELQEETNNGVCLVDFSGNPTFDVKKEVITEPGVNIKWIQESGTDLPVDFPVYSVHFPKSVSEAALRAFLETLVDEFYYVVVALPSGYNSVIKKVLANSDKVYFLATDSEEAVYETDLLLNHVVSDLNNVKTSLEIVLNQSSDDTISHRDKISDQLGIRVQHQLPIIEDDYVDAFESEPPFIQNNPDHPYSNTIRRIAHEVEKRSLGLALGSGAARGLAHIGVLQVLEDENIKPDRIAGSSMGALIGAGYALGDKPTQMMQHVSRFNKSGGFFNFTDLSLPPNRSILRASRFRNFLEDLFGDATFDDVNIPLSITVSDLNNADIKVITEGPIVEAVLASISIPMIFEPVSKNGSTYIDGGVLEPVPVEPLKQEGLDQIVAVNPIPPRTVLKEQDSERLKKIEEENDFHPIVKSLVPFGNNNLIDIGMRTIEAIESLLSEQSTKKADVVIDPYLTELSWFDFDDFNLFVEQGRRSAREKIDTIKSILKPENNRLDNQDLQKSD